MAHGLDAEQTLVLATCLAAAEHPGVLLLDTPGTRVANRRFIEEFKPAAVVTVNRPGAGEEPFADSIWRELFPTSKALVVVNPSSRRLLLQAAAWPGPPGARCAFVAARVTWREFIPHRPRRRA